MQQKYRAKEECLDSSSKTTIAENQHSIYIYTTQTKGTALTAKMSPSREPHPSKSLMLWRKLEAEATTETGDYIYIDASKINKGKRVSGNAKFEVLIIE